MNELLCRHGHKVFGLSRNGLVDDKGGREAVALNDRQAVEELIKRLKPDEIYYLAAHHHSSEERQEQFSALLERSLDTHMLYLSYVLEAITWHHKTCRLFYASSCRVFGNPDESPQTEDSLIRPVDAYGMSKAGGSWLCRYFREERGVFASSGILYNHESPRRPAHFVIKKIIRMALDVRDGKRDAIVVGDLKAEVDWGYAPDYVDAMRRILDLNDPGDFIIATGRLHTIGAVIEMVLEALGLPSTTPVRENGEILKRKNMGKPLVGNIGKVTKATDWTPKTSLRQIITLMIEEEEMHRNY